LTSIKSYAETLLDWAMDDPETSHRFLGVINSEAERMTRLVQDLLQLSRLDNSKIRLETQEVSVDKLVKECIEKVRLEAGNKKQTIESYVIGELPTISADRDRLEQVALNILSNAIKYTPPGGRVIIKCCEENSRLITTVTDTGMGIPRESIPRVFERFYRVDKARSRDQGGTGLGLAIVKHIVESHGGDVFVNSQIGEGSTFGVSFLVM
jgi:two-component system sensor histidine kinase VicK